MGLGDMSVGGPGLASPSPQGPLPSSPFRLPPAYQEAKERKVQAVTELRQHIKSVSPPLVRATLIRLLFCSSRPAAERF